MQKKEIEPILEPEEKRIVRPFKHGHPGTGIASFNSRDNVKLEPAFKIPDSEFRKYVP